MGFPFFFFGLVRFLVIRVGFRRTVTEARDRERLGLRVETFFLRRPEDGLT
jgi:uncharacterized membrane protein